MKRIASCLLIAALLLCLAVPAMAATVPTLPISAKVGEEAPDFELTTLTGEPFKLSEQRGKVVYLNIWATWCPPCVAEMGDIQKLYDAYGEDDLVVIGASVDEDAGEVEAFLREEGYTYPVAMDADFRLAGELYATEYIPLSVFISPEGEVTYMEARGLEYLEMEALYRQAKGEK